MTNPWKPERKGDPTPPKPDTKPPSKPSKPTPPREAEVTRPVITIDPDDDRTVNWPLIESLSTKPHRLLNIADDFEAQIRETPLSWTGEVFQEARNAHHLFDLVGIPAAADSTPALAVDARAYLAIRAIIDLREKLARIGGWHSRETGEAGTVGDFCNECGHFWPCDTRRVIDGTYEDD